VHRTEATRAAQEGQRRALEKAMLEVNAAGAAIGYARTAPVPQPEYAVPRKKTSMNKHGCYVTGEMHRLQLATTDKSNYCHFSRPISQGIEIPIFCLRF
jgi:hypothetical protein